LTKKRIKRRTNFEPRQSIRFWGTAAACEGKYLRHLREGLSRPVIFTTG